MPSLLDHCASFLAELVAFEPSLFSGDHCRVVAERLARVEKACAAARARAAARDAACGAHRQAGFDNAADCMGRWSGSSRGAAAAELKAADAAERCPQTKAALASGEVSLGQAGEIARAEAECPGSEPELLDLARAPAGPGARGGPQAPLGRHPGRGAGRLPACGQKLPPLVGGSRHGALLRGRRTPGRACPS